MRGSPSRPSGLLSQDLVESLVALLHAVRHSGLDRGIALFGGGETHDHGHRRLLALGSERLRHERLFLPEVLVDDDEVLGRYLAIDAVHAELALLRMAPRVQVLASDAEIDLAHRHRPSRRA